MSTIKNQQYMANVYVPEGGPTEMDWEARNEAARARWVLEFGADERCPNCAAQPIIDHAETSCLLNVLIGIYRDGHEDLDEFDEYELLERHRRCDVDGFWDGAHKLYSALANGDFDSPQ